MRFAPRRIGREAVDRLLIVGQARPKVTRKPTGTGRLGGDAWHRVRADGVAIPCRAGQGRSRVPRRSHLDRFGRFRINVEAVMLRNLLGLVCAMGGGLFYFVSAKALDAGNAGAAEAMYRATWIMWGTALVLFVWAVAGARQ